MVIGVPDAAADPLLLVLVLLLLLPLDEHAVADAKTVTAAATATKTVRTENIRRSSSPLRIRRERIARRLLPQ
jgi:hypothetical protein